MPVLRVVSVLIMDGELKLSWRERSRKWQAAGQCAQFFSRKGYLPFI